MTRRRDIAAAVDVGAYSVHLLIAQDRYRPDRLRVAQSGLREGVILAAHRAGGSWRAEIRELARGWDS